MERQVIVFNKAGTKMSTIDLQPLYYLKTEPDWIKEKLLWAEGMDGIAIQVDWDKREIKMIRYAE